MQEHDFFKDDDVYGEFRFTEKETSVVEEDISEVSGDSYIYGEEVFDTDESEDISIIDSSAEEILVYGEESFDDVSIEDKEQDTYNGTFDEKIQSVEENPSSSDTEDDYISCDYTEDCVKESVEDPDVLSHEELHKEGDITDDIEGQDIVGNEETVLPNEQEITLKGEEPVINDTPSEELVESDTLTDNDVVNSNADTVGLTPEEGNNYICPDMSSESSPVENVRFDTVDDAKDETEISVEEAVSALDKELQDDREIRLDFNEDEELSKDIKEKEVAESGHFGFIQNLLKMVGKPDNNPKKLTLKDVIYEDDEGSEDEERENDVVAISLDNEEDIDNPKDEVVDIFGDKCKEFSVEKNKKETKKNNVSEGGWLSSLGNGALLGGGCGAIALILMVGFFSLSSLERTHAQIQENNAEKERQAIVTQMLPEDVAADDIERQLPTAEAWSEEKENNDGLIVISSSKGNQDSIDEIESVSEDAEEISSNAVDEMEQIEEIESVEDEGDHSKTDDEPNTEKKSGNDGKQSEEPVDMLSNGAMISDYVVSNIATIAGQTIPGADVINIINANVGNYVVVDKANGVGITVASGNGSSATVNVDSFYIISVAGNLLTFTER